MRHFTTGEVAEMLSVTADKVLDLIRTGQLGAVDVSLHRGGKARWRISDADLENFLLRRRSQPPTPAPKRKRRQPQEITKYY